jgi:hypothetical protein
MESKCERGLEFKYIDYKNNNYSAEINYTLSSNSEN